VFVKDILIYSKDRDEHTIHLRTVLQTLREHQLHSKYKKHEFWLEKVVFLGHVVSKEGIKVDLLKVKVVTECPRLSNVTETRNFLDLTEYYRVWEGLFKDNIFPDQFAEGSYKDRKKIK